MPDIPADSPPQTFEGALAQLQQIVHELEEGDLGLETSLSRFEQGIGLLRNCYRILEQAEHKIEILTGQDAAGNPITAPFDATATFDAGDKPAKKAGRRKAPGKQDSPAADGTSPDQNSDRPDGGLF
jgi:exodeoxyribonuclease VII small subunit